jgi:hypothetical protein
VKRRAPNSRDNIVEDLTVRQRNTTWPHVLRGGRAVDEYLWKGAKDAPMVQRVGAFILALAYLVVALFFIGWTSNGGGWLSGLFSLCLIAVGAKIVHSAAQR